MILPPLKPFIFLLAAAGELTALAADPVAAQTSAEPESAKAVKLSAEARAQVFKPFQTDWASLSPDGKYLAYTLREADKLYVVVLEIDQPKLARAKVLVGTDDAASPFMGELRAKKTAMVNWMKWVTPTRVVVETNRNFAVPKSGTVNNQDGKRLRVDPSAAMAGISAGSDIANVPGAILAFDLDGGNAKMLVTPFDIPETRFASPTISARTPLWRPDQPVDNSALDPLEPATDDPNDANLLQQSYRSPAVFDLCSKDPESIWVRAPSKKGYDILRLNVVTGKLQTTVEEEIEPEMTVLADRQGVVKVGMRTSARVSFPHVFRLVQNHAFSRWADLDQIAGQAENPRFRVSPASFFEEREIPLGFNEEATLLYFASNVGKDKYGIYALDVKTGKRTEQAIEHPLVDLIEPAPDGFSTRQELVYDRFDRHLVGVRFQETGETTLWLRPEWASLQTHLEKTLPGQSIRILEWDKAGQRYLFLARSIGNPGGFYLFDGNKGTITEFAERAPWTDAATAPKTLPFSVEVKPGMRIAGTITLPNFVRVKPIPMVVLLPEDPWRRTSNEYDSRVNALTNTGLAVVQINMRGSWGFGIKFREAVREGFEKVQVEDIVATTDYLAKQLPVGAKRVALLGTGRGGYLALRALQLRPDRFRCAVVVEPTVNLDNWLGEATWLTRDSRPAMTQALLGGTSGLKGAAIVDHPEPLTRPVQFVVFPGPRGGKRTQAYLDVRRLNDRMDSHKETYERVEMDEDYLEGLPGARSEVFSKIEDFLNTQIYAYDVKVGTPSIIK